MTTAIFQSFNPDVRGWGAETLAFGAPELVHVAHSLADVPRVLALAEAANLAGKYVAVFVAYEAAAAFDPAYVTHPPVPGLPLAWVAIFAKAEGRRQKVEVKAGEAQNIEHPTPDARAITHHSPFTPWTPAVARDDYAAAIRRIRDYIAAGDTYQVNYTFPLHATLQGNPVAAFQALGAAQGAGYSAYLNLGSHQLLCLSPELFFEREHQKSGGGVRENDLPDSWRLTMRPMKGTLARGRFLAEDLERMRELAACEKNRAENLMILDMLRNDAGRLALPGTVRVPRMFEVERYRTVLQMTSTVEATLPGTTTLLETFAALFPCGSITGAPKVRTMQIIRELEKYPRGAYTGAIGLLKPDGSAIFNVAIRTIMLTPQESGGGVLAAVFGVGGGITWDSTSEGEYDECMLKAAFLIGAAGDASGDRHRSGASPRPQQDFDLLESLRLENGDWFLLERHLARMRASADYFSRPFPEPELRAALENLRTSHPDGTWKVRLLAGPHGIRTEAQPLSGGCRSRIPPDFWRVALATEPVDSRDVFLFHKTTRRGVYEAALKAHPGMNDVLLWNERGELTESCFANIVLEIGGELLTPPVECGLLAGTFRQELLARTIIKECVLRREDLAKATATWLINSVRGWIRTEMNSPMT